ncbi:MAG: ABC transporter permease [Armatimonadota bacterium]|nr:ABC transporter permease [Armatimonadota bacterium]
MGGPPLLRLVLLLAALVVANFLLPRALPGSPLAPGGGETAVAFLPAAARTALRETYALDRPLREQFRRYLAGLARGDLGRSLATHRPVAAMVAERLPWSLALLLPAVLLAALIGGALGTAAAVHPHRAPVRAAAAVTVAAGALPEFLVAMCLLVALGVHAGLFPAGGARTPFAGGGPAAVADLLWHMALPLATLVVGLTPAFFLLSRGALVAVLGEPYLVTARGKGLPPRRVLWHAWRNALPPLLTLAGLRMAFAVTGAAVVERIFAYPGMGLLLFEAVARRDYPVLQGIFLVASAAVLTATFLLDAAAARLDPRLRERRA